ncbi:D-alanyl-D-alanine carboxypeptidase/D-alanyl-D-alanine-endopeptidase [Undibacterium sp. RTI2.1]|uniref:D-alanyl-D-alanine carboxypeptidase/D-alanyl-D-alanine endopeptidase n=1 Tax=unclassified Undibacterium TaxID=2630295 RepID=UPI002AB59FE7|nr:MULTISPECIES: D-alanyl-D-alanine carboxypeptidase/D-alanyl-D-alanine-endopeptidase [unclassified Undibacterium]MDY7538762.1 D-alanyl-D-alanine carboxypeptidase/D-alanyl-D-alanine-endopeptidase [Undibacterium sp. 5I1]MEB0032922.1 D-alanyl-D-alanine carboxypeptidase/D-alanyl-D-alanine-endopeptidase [Undibacterium sp. RTI2.1]MEB0118251.1 D-alanyl-D-alanine carboxypeptidase/D-alanyl-D-alanine-endopeptidase [Undibacterium sp. RTI2.2]MEB0229701.1 D-alanyl-D-alanine carboxypeptidase/D-alanyl-D-alan
MIATHAFAQNALPSSLELAFKKVGVPANGLSMVVMPADGGPATLLLSPDIAVSPASTIKLVTTLVAMEELGPTFRWKTQILSTTAIKQTGLPSDLNGGQNGELLGDIYLRGGGDPNLTWDKLGLMLRTLRGQGIRNIIGDIVLDRHYFQPDRLDADIVQFDEKPDTYYNVIPDALLINANLSGFEFESTSDNIKILSFPPMAQVIIKNQLRLNNSPCASWENIWIPPTVEVDNNRTTVTLIGNFPRNCKAIKYTNIFDRNRYIEHLIQQLWQEIGGTWIGHVKDGFTPATASILVERQSDTLADTIKIINKQSDNVMARLLYLSLGAEFSEAKNYATTLQAADAHVRQWFSKKGITDEGLILENGSGLSRTEKITARQLGKVLQLASHSNWFPEFASSMPIVAVDGTMRKRLKDSPVEGRARIKTGSLKNTLSIAGYIKDSHEKLWIVVAIINDEKAGKARPAMDELILWISGDQGK